MTATARPGTTTAPDAEVVEGPGSSSDAPIPADAPAAPPRRPRVLLTGTALATGATIMVFAGLIGIYLAARSGFLAEQAMLPAGERAAWLGEATIPLTPGTVSLFTFAISVITMQWAVDAVGRNDRVHAYLALGLTILLGLSVINATSFLYIQSGLTVAGNQAGLLIYVITGAHLVMIAAALLFATVMTVRTLGGEYQGRDREGIVAASMFWYATIAVYAVIWYAIYVTK